MGGGPPCRAGARLSETLTCDDWAEPAILLSGVSVQHRSLMKDFPDWL